TYGVGNGDLYSIRGLGYKILPMEQAINQLTCRTVDAAMLAMSDVLQPLDANSVEDIQTITYGSMTILPPGIQYVDRPLPDLSKNGIPIIGMLSQKEAINTGTYRTQAIPTYQDR